jgi:hypothetical protein
MLIQSPTQHVLVGWLQRLERPIAPLLDARPPAVILRVATLGVHSDQVAWAELEASSLGLAT